MGPGLEIKKRDRENAKQAKREAKQRRREVRQAARATGNKQFGFDAVHGYMESQFVAEDE
jgi:hypothetical protein